MTNPRMINPFLRFAVLFATVAFFQDLIPSGFAQHTSTEAPAAAAPVLKGFPFTNESLAYTVEWPSGLSLGEGHLSATSDQGNWNFELMGENGQPDLIQTSGCLSGRCGLSPSLHVHADGTMHLDTMNSFSLMGVGAIVHLFVDVIGGNTWWAGGIPR